MASTEGQEGNKTAVIYHANCSDGWASAYLAAKALGLQDSDLIPAQYDDYGYAVDQACEKAGPDGVVYLVDFSVPGDVLLQMCKRVREVLVFDHHVSAVNKLKGVESPNLFMYLNVNECGATLVYNHFFDGSGGYDRFRIISHYARDRDLWLWQLPSSKEISEYLFTVDRTIASWDNVWMDDDDYRDTAVEAGSALLKAQSIRVAKAASNAVDCKVVKPDIYDRRYANDFTVVSDPHDYLYGKIVGAYNDISEIGAYLLATTGDAIHFALMYMVQSDGSIICSVRSKDGYARQIAERFGGGGHDNAAGFKLICGVGKSPGDALDYLHSAFSIGHMNAIHVYSGRVIVK